MVRVLVKNIELVRVEQGKTSNVEHFYLRFVEKCQVDMATIVVESDSVDYLA
jgi:hypothetical protein